MKYIPKEVKDQLTGTSVFEVVEDVPEFPGGMSVIGKKVESAEKTAMQGTMKVEGKVIDEKGSPVIGATVLVEGTNTGVITDLDGNFTISVPSKDGILSVSYIGMATAKAKVQPKVTVTLKNE